MQCPYCFAQLPDGSQACGYCGGQLYNEMQYSTNYPNGQDNYNQNANPEYPNYPGSADMNQYNQYDNQAQPQDYNQYNNQAQPQDYNQYNNQAQPQDYNQYNNQAQPQDYNQYNKQAQPQDYNQYNQNTYPQQAYGYDNNAYNQQAIPYQAATTAPKPAKSGSGKSNKAIIISVIAVAVIAIIIGLVLIIGGGKNKDKDKDKDPVTTTEATTTEATTTEEPTTEATTTEATTTEEPTTEATTTEEPTTETPVTTGNYNGKYVFTHYDQNGELVPVGDVENTTGSHLDSTMMIYNNTCLLLSDMENVSKVYCDITIQDGVVSLDDGSEIVSGTYNQEEQTIRITYNDTTMVYTLDPGDGSTYDMAGDYSLAYGMYGNETYTLESMRETMEDPSYDMTLKVYGVLCTLTSFENGSIKVGSTYLQAVGTDLYFEDGSGAIMGEYNPENQTITMFTSGLDLVFELDTAQ